MIPKVGRSRSLASVAFVLVLALAGIGYAIDRDSPSAAHLAVGYSAQIFINVDAEDARTATKVLAEQVMARHLPGGTSESVILSGLASFEKAFREERIDLAGIISDEYVRLRDRVPIEPVFVTANEAGPYHQLVLLARRDGGARSLLDLRNKRLTLSSDQSKTIHLVWLETLLMKEGFRRPEDFFSAIREVKRPSQAILPVFFQQADACLTTQQAFDLVCELNPQVGRDLVVLARSRDIAGGVLVFRTGYDPSAKAKIAEALGELQTDPQGTQLLGIFRMSRLLPWRPEYLESVEALLKEHESLRLDLAPRASR